MAEQEEIDFSSYLVDIDEGETSSNGGGSSNYAGGALNAIPLQTHSAKNWTSAFTTKSIPSVSPSPPETTNSDSSYKAVSTPSTAPSSVASTSYPGSSGSWGTVKSSSNRTSPGASRTATPRSSKPALASSGGVPANHTNAGSQSSGGANGFFAPPLSLSFNYDNYDFAHDPSSNLALTQPKTTVPSQSTSLASSAPMPPGPSKHTTSQASSSGQHRRLLPKGTEPVTAPVTLSENAVAPSSGPQSSARGHRSRQHSSSLAISPNLPNGLSYYAPMSASPASPTVSHHTKPYCRPGEANMAPTAVAGPSSASSVAKKPSKRKSMSTANVSIPAAFPTDAEGRPVYASPREVSRHPPQAMHDNAYLPPPDSQSYREPASGIFSPVSPSFDSFANFSMPNFAYPTPPSLPTSHNAASPSHQQSAASSASTPSDVVLSAVNAPSPFDPKNFTDLSVNPLMPQDQVLGSGSGQVADAKSPPLDLNQAMALAGVGGKWFNWASLQEPEAAVPVTPEILSSVLSTEPLLPDESATSRGRETSLAPEVFDGFDGESPEAMAAKDPLATHLWRLYAKARSGLPNGARMENITWRMMSLKLNKQRAAEAQAAAAAAAQETASVQPGTSEVPPVNGGAEAVEEEGRGRRGRSVATDSASPQDPNDFEGMDWRQQSRSRSRAAHIAGGMDWRAASRSRSRAPNMRISIPRGTSGFQMPTYYDTGESFDSAERTDVYAAQPSTAPSAFSNGHAATQSSSSEANSDSNGYSLIQATLKQLIASTEPPASLNKPSPPSASELAQAQPPASAPLPMNIGTSSNAAYTYVPPAPLPISPGAWLQPSQTSAELVPTPQSSYAPSTLSQSAQSHSQYALPSSADADSSSSQSQNSISQSVEAYLSTLEYQNSVVNLPPHRHVGSVPGLFHEQDLKHNQHSEYGFLPKLVRKTSFDASYPAQLAQQQQKSQGRKGHQPTMSQAHLSPKHDAGCNPFLPNTSGYARSPPSYSTPGTPSHLYYNHGFDLNFPQMNPMAIPNSPAQIGPQLLSPEGSATMEAFKRLQAAQAMQAASSQQQQQQQQQQEQQQQQHYQMQLQMQMQMMQNMQYSAFMDPNILAQSAPASSILPHHFNQPNQMHVNPAQLVGAVPYAPFGPNSLPDSGLSPWVAQSAESSPGTAGASPEEAAAEYEKGRSLAASLASSRSNSITNITALVHSPAESSADSATPPSAPPKKSHARTQSNAGAAGTPSEPGTPTTCINCKTTNTPLWRRDENGQPLCNACQLFRKLHGSDRPVSLHNSVIKKRNRTRTAKDAPKKSGSRAQSRRESISHPVT